MTALERVVDHARRASEAAAVAERLAGAPDPDPLGACRWLTRAAEQLAEAGAAAAEAAIRSGNSQAKVAAALGVPPSTLAGARKEWS